MNIDEETPDDMIVDPIPDRSTWLVGGGVPISYLTPNDGPISNNNHLNLCKIPFYDFH